jgi:hypothetical protein
LCKSHSGVSWAVSFCCSSFSIRACRSSDRTSLPEGGAKDTDAVVPEDFPETLSTPPRHLHSPCKRKDRTCRSIEDLARMLKSALDRGSSAIRSIVMADRTIFHTQQGGRAAKVIVESLSAVSFLVIAGLLAGEPVAIAQENPQGSQIAAPATMAASPCLPASARRSSRTISATPAKWRALRQHLEWPLLSE